MKPLICEKIDNPTYNRWTYSRWGHLGMDCVLNDYAERIALSDNKKGTCNDVNDELLNILGTSDKKGKIAGANSIKTYFKLLRNKIIKKDPNIEVSYMPKCPKYAQLRVKSEEKQRVADRFDDPIIINAGIFTPLIVNGLRDGIARKQYPQVIFCLSY